MYKRQSLIILVTHLPGVGTAFKDIFVGAFSPQSVAGGMLGVTVQKAMRFGVARGLFSNEAGMGSTPHAHATAKVSNPCEPVSYTHLDVYKRQAPNHTIREHVLLFHSSITPLQKNPRQ